MIVPFTSPRTVKLASLVDTVIVETNGFGIFKDKERLAFLRRLANERGLIVLTDSDSAGMLIRNYLGGSVSNILLVLFFALAGGLLAGMAAAFRPR